MKRLMGRALRNTQSNILAGIIIIGPLFATYLIFSYLLSALAEAGRPMVRLFAAYLPREWLTQPWLQSVSAILLTLALL